MRKIAIICFILLTAILLTALLMAGCNSISNTRSAASAAEIIQKDYNYEKLFYGTHKIEFEIHLETIGYPNNIINPAGKLIEDLVYQSKDLDGYAAYLEKRFTENDSASDFEPFLNDDGTQYVYHSSLTENYTVEFQNEDYIIINYNTWYYRSGAAHGNYQVQYYIIDMAERKLLYINELINQVPDSVLAGIITEECGIENFQRDNIWPPDTISVKKEGAELLWNVYSIAPYSAGLVSIIIPNVAANQYLTDKGKAIRAAR
jgi:hypothetical protein